MKRNNSRSGFTLVELIVIIGIIGVLSSIALASFSDARAKSRDEKRVTDVAQIQLALRLYVEQNGSGIDCSGGLKIDGSTTVVSLGSGAAPCDDGSAILSFIESSLGSIPTDPRGSGSSDYYYYFDNVHSCVSAPGGISAMIAAVNLEKLSGNITEVCGSSSGNGGGLQDTTSYGGSINPSVPYVRLINFTNEI